jgi:hypothetical protein
MQAENFYTVTMARVYAAQGHWHQAAAIYRHLLKQEPRRQDLADALAEAERRMKPNAYKAEQRLAPLVREWALMQIRYQRIKKLEAIQRRL